MTKKQTQISHLAGLGLVSQQVLHDINNLATITLMNLDLLRSKMVVNEEFKPRFAKMDDSVRDLIRICRNAHDLMKSADSPSVSGRDIYEAVRQIFAVNLQKHAVDFKVVDEQWDFEAPGFLTEFVGLIYVCIQKAKDRFYERQDASLPAEIEISCLQKENIISLRFSDNSPMLNDEHRSCFLLQRTGDDSLMQAYQELLESLSMQVAYQYINHTNQITFNFARLQL